MTIPLQVQPMVSAIIATRGRAELLRRAVRSIAAQDYDGRIEIVVVFDQSDIDALNDLRTSLPPTVELITMANHLVAGLAGARNSGIARATGLLVAFCDDDDEWLPTKLRRQVDAWQSYPEAAVMSSGIEIVTRDGTVTRIPPLVTQRSDLLQSRVGEIHPSSFLFRRTALGALSGGVDESIPSSYGEDYDLLLRMTEFGPIVSVQAALVIVHWDRDSYFAGRWSAMASGLGFIVEKHPDLLFDNDNAARMSGQIAFAHAASGDYRAARIWLRRTLRHRLREPRAWLTVLAMSRVVSPRTIVTALNKRGRGI
ncbi:glycosyl transferase family 2 [Actinomycetales bacterium SN12]|nr:glycosyl transferase family 2 [Actinomycetales bacterium SN12]